MRRRRAATRRGTPLTRARRAPSSNPDPITRSRSAAGHQHLAWPGLAPTRRRLSRRSRQYRRRGSHSPVCSPARAPRCRAPAAPRIAIAQRIAPCGPEGYIARDRRRRAHLAASGNRAAARTTASCASGLGYASHGRPSPPHGASNPMMLNNTVARKHPIIGHLGFLMTGETRRSLETTRAVPRSDTGAAWQLRDFLDDRRHHAHKRVGRSGSSL